MSMRSPDNLFMDPVFVHKTASGKQHDASVEFNGESDGPSLSVISYTYK